ncbi:MAG: hypothetical protein HUU20_18680 [Pirellulales bacterium]|nr:hypothetical protein [Pirellulales bacterium]
MGAAALCLLLSAPVAAQSVVIQGPSQVVKGFPIIIKVTVSGPAVVERFDLNSSTGAVRVDLISETGQRYAIVAPSRTHMLELHRGAALDAVSTEIDRGESRSMLLDLQSIPGTDGLSMDDVPPGRFRLSITLEEARLEHATSMRPTLGSNEIEITLLRPTPAEAQVIATIRDDGRHRLKLRDGVRWGNTLVVGADLESHDLRGISPTAREQLGLHLAMTRFLSGRRRIDPEAIAALKAEKFPAHLESEHAVLVAELKRSVGTASPQELSSLAERYPDMKWRVEGIARGGSFVDRVNRLAENRAEKHR